MSCRLLLAVGLIGLAATELRAAESTSQAIDRFMAAAWVRDKVQPAPMCADPEFIRRVYLDLAGRIPSLDETASFLRDTSATKRSQRIDVLLGSGEFAKHWSENFHVLLTGGPAFAGDPAWRAWLQQSLLANRGWDEMAREMLRARSAKPGERGPSYFLVSRLSQGETGIDAVTRDVSRFFFGVDIQCARCHKHPEVKQWKQESYWGLAAYFNRSYTVAVKGQNYLAERASGELEYTPKNKPKAIAAPTFLTGEKLTEPPSSTAPPAPAKGKTAGPAAAGAESPANYLVPPEDAKEKTRVPVPRFSRRDKFVEVAIQPRNPYFKRAIVNYIWSQLLGIGLVEPIDQMHDANRGSHPELLDYLADDLAAHHFDLRELIRGIVNSRAYQLSSRYPAGANPAADAAFACGPNQPLSPHQLATSLLVAAGYYDALQATADAKTRSDRSALRACLETQQAERLRFVVKNLSGDGSAPAGVAEAMFAANNREFADFLAKGGLAARLAACSDDAVPAELFLRLLSRPATPDEADRVRQYLRTRSNRRAAACEQAVWALVTSSEFRFNH